MKLLTESCSDLRGITDHPYFCLCLCQSVPVPVPVPESVSLPVCVSLFFAWKPFPLPRHGWKYMLMCMYSVPNCDPCQLRPSVHALLLHAPCIGGLFATPLEFIYL